MAVKRRWYWESGFSDGFARVTNGFELGGLRVAPSQGFAGTGISIISCF